MPWRRHASHDESISSAPTIVPAARLAAAVSPQPSAVRRRPRATPGPRGADSGASWRGAGEGVAERGLLKVRINTGYRSPGVSHAKRVREAPGRRRRSSRSSVARGTARPRPRGIPGGARKGANDVAALAALGKSPSLRSEEDDLSAPRSSEKAMKYSEYHSAPPPAPPCPPPSPPSPPPHRRKSSDASIGHHDPPAPLAFLWRLAGISAETRRCKGGYCDGRFVEGAVEEEEEEGE